MHIDHQHSSAAGVPAIDRERGRRRWLRGPVALALATAALAGAGGSLPATAHADLGECRDGYFCAWEHADYNILIYSNAGNDPNWHDNGAGDRASSVFNDGLPHSLDSVRAYRHVDYGGASICFPRGRAESNLRGHFWREGVRLGNWNDEISSHQWVGGC